MGPSVKTALGLAMLCHSEHIGLHVNRHSFAALWTKLSMGCHNNSAHPWRHRVHCLHSVVYCQYCHMSCLLHRLYLAVGVVGASSVSNEAVSYIHPVLFSASA